MSSNLDMKEAVRILAAEKGISEESLLQVLADALVSAYKRRPGAADEVEVEIDPDSLEMRFIAYDIDDEGNWVNPRDDTPDAGALGRSASRIRWFITWRNVWAAMRPRAPASGVSSRGLTQLPSSSMS